MRLSLQSINDQNKMNMKKLSLIFLMSFALFAVNAQVFKKLKDKVVKAVDKNTNTPTTNNNSASNEKSTDKWCLTDTINGIYDKAYSASGKISILYDESCLGLGADSKGYMMVLTERTGNKTEYVVIDNGKEIGRYKEMKDEYLPCRGRGKKMNSPDQSKYIIVDSAKITTQATKGQTVKTGTIDANNAQRGMEIAKQTDEYKKMSPEEKKQFDEMMKNMPQMAAEYNKTMGNKTFDIPGTQGGSTSYISGYRVVVNKKEYGKFSMVTGIAVSADEKNVFITGADQKGVLLFQANDKKLPLAAKGFTGSGKLIVNASSTKAVYAEVKQKSEAETEKDMKDFEHAKYVYRVLKADGTVAEVTTVGNFGNALLILSENGSLVYVNEKTGEIAMDGKLAGKFNLGNAGDEGLNEQTVLVGSSTDKICYYSSDGSLNYADGSKKNMGIIFPSVIRQDGKVQLSWFRQCGNDIYIGKMAF